MPLLKRPSKKAFEHNLKAEMHAGKPMKQALAISYSVKRAAGKKKKMADGGAAGPKLDPAKQKKVADSMKKAFGFYDGGEALSADDAVMYGEDMLDEKKLRHADEIRAASSEPVADDSDEREMEMRHGAPSRHEDELDARKEHMSGIDDASDAREMDMMKRKKMAKGGEVDMRDESMPDNAIDSASSRRSEYMLDAKPMRHGDEKRAASHDAVADDSDDMELDMMRKKPPEDAYSDEGIVRMARGGIAKEIMRKKMYAEGGEVDLSRNADEDENMEDDLSWDALRKENYSDSEGLSELDYDTSRSVGHDLPDEDEHDMVDKIRAKYSKRR